MYLSDNLMFKSLDDEDEVKFRKWPHEHEAEMAKAVETGAAKSFHPVVRDEWNRMQTNKTNKGG